MDRKWIDVSGKTEEEAINKGLKELGLSRDDVSVEILERAKSGFLGIGGKPAKVRITYGLEEIVEVSDMRSAPAQKEEAPVKKAGPGYGAGAVSSGQSDSGTDRSGKPAKPAKVEKPAKSEKASKLEKAAKPVKQPVPVKVEKPLPQPESEAPEALGEPCDDENAQAIRKFLEGLLVHMGSSAQVKVYLTEKDRYKVILEGEKLGSLIGRRGETLDAIQQLTSYSVNRNLDKRIRIHVDAENYRRKREQNLENLARKVAAKVTKYKRNVTLEPMNAYERHVIHAALQDVPGVTTYSMGSEPNRRVIVAYDREGNR